MNKWFFLIGVVSVLVVAACSGSRQAAKPNSRPVHDTIVVVRYDTIVRAFPLYVFDTTATSAKSDTFTWTTPQVKTVLEVKTDTIVRYKVRTEIRPDTIAVIQRDTIVRDVVVKEYVETCTENKIPFWLLVCAIILALVGAGIGRLKS